MKEQHQTIVGMGLLIICMGGIIAYYTHQYIKSSDQQAKAALVKAALVKAVTVTENRQVEAPKPQTPDLENQINGLQTMIDKASEEEARKLQH